MSLRKLWEIVKNARCSPWRRKESNPTERLNNYIENVNTSDQCSSRAGILFHLSFHLSEPNTKPGKQTSNKCLFKVTEGFPGGSDGDESDCNAGDAGSIPGSGRSPGGNGNPLQYSCLEKFMDRGYSPWGGKESDTTGRLTLNRVTEVGDSRQGPRGRLIFSCGGCLNAEKPRLGKLSLRTTRGATK